MKNTLLIVFILTMLLGCNSEEEYSYARAPSADAPNLSSTVNFTYDDVWSRIEPTINLFSPIEQSSYEVEFISFLKNNENNSYTRISPVDSKNCLKDEQCDLSNIVYFVTMSYWETEDCLGENCGSGSICTLIADSQTLLYSAEWDSLATTPKNLPNTCLTGDNGGNTHYDCTENMAGENHDLAQSSIFQSLSNEGSGLKFCF